MIGARIHCQQYLGCFVGVGPYQKNNIVVPEIMLSNHPLYNSAMVTLYDV